MEYKLIGLKLLLTELGIESEFEYITPIQLEEVFHKEGWEDVELLNKYTKLYWALKDLHQGLPGYKT